jgi:hypothetical protein
MPNGGPLHKNRVWECGGDDQRFGRGHKLKGTEHEAYGETREWLEHSQDVLGGTSRYDVALDT